MKKISMVEIRRATEEDSPKILQFIQEYFSYTEIDEKELARRMGDSTFTYHIAQEKNIFQGYAEWEIIDNAEKIIRLNGIAVLPPFRGKGISDALIQAGENVSRERGMKKMTLLVAEKNTAAKELYVRNGWSFVRRHLKKINGENAEVWEKELK